MIRSSLAHQIAATLENWIFQEAEGLRPGQRIREIELAKKLCTSQTPVREALRLLEERGVVLHQPNRGSTVIDLSQKDVNEILSVRIPLETIALDSARTNVIGTDSADLIALLDALSESADANDLLSYHERHINFHKHIWRLSGNERLVATLERLCTPLWAFYRQRVRQRPDRSLSGRRTHEPLVEFIIAKEKPLLSASEITKEHYHDVAGFQSNKVTAE
ncbi:MAG: GntR family transcriptional regulator [Candidatus Zixiibacteriota bacterium]